MKRYRAWEKHFGEMIEVLNIDFDSKMINKGSAWRMFHEIELMEYVGMTDTDGKAICEYDIVLTKYGTPGVIRKHETDGSWVFDTNDGVFPVFEDDAYKIIGNTYENKNLLHTLGGS